MPLLSSLRRVTLAVAAAVTASTLTLGPVQAAAATAAPNAPTNLTVSLESAIPWHLRLNWTDNTPASDPNAETFVEIERCLGAGCTDWTNVFLGYTPGWDMVTFVDQDSQKPDHTTYSYRVRGRNDAGMSEWSNVAVGTTGWRAPAAPTAFTVAYVGANARGLGGDPLLTWTDNATSEFGYRVNRCEPINCLATRVAIDLPANATSYRDTTAIDGAEYWYSVQAMGGSGFDSFSPRLTHVAGAGLPAPTRVTLTRTTSGFRLTWRNQVSRPLVVWRCDTLICVDGTTGDFLPMLFVPKATLRAGTTSWTDRFAPVAGTAYAYRIQVVTATAVSHPVYVRITA